MSGESGNKPLPAAFGDHAAKVEAMTDDASRHSRSDPRTGEWRPGDDMTDIPGDPGVGGLMADPQEPDDRPKTRPRPAGSPSADPEPPRAHGDWLPNHAWKGAAKPPDDRSDDAG